MLSELHKRQPLKNSHEYPLTYRERAMRRRFCCAVKVVERERLAIVRRCALAGFGREPVSTQYVVEHIAAVSAVHALSFDEALAYFWFGFVEEAVRRFVDERVECSGE